MHLYRMKYIKCLRTGKYSLEHKCEWNLPLVWLFLAIVTCYLNCLDRVVLAHPFWAVATFPVCFSVLSCWTNRAPSMPSPSTFLHSCRGNDAHCSHDLANMSVDVSTISPYAYIWYYHFFSQRKHIHASLIILLCFQLGYFSIHRTNASTKATPIKLRNSVKGQCLVGLVQVCSLTSLSRTSSPLLVAL